MRDGIVSMWDEIIDFSPVYFLANGSDIQASLAELTGQRTVPSVFVNGKHLGK